MRRLSAFGTIVLWNVDLPPATSFFKTPSSVVSLIASCTTLSCTSSFSLEPLSAPFGTAWAWATAVSTCDSSFRVGEVGRIGLPIPPSTSLPFTSPFNLRFSKLLGIAGIIGTIRSGRLLGVAPGLGVIGGASEGAIASGECPQRQLIRVGRHSNRIAAFWGDI